MTTVMERPDADVRTWTVAPASWPTVRALVESCSPATLRRRFFLPVDPDPRRILRTHRRYLLPEQDGHAWVGFVGAQPAGLLTLADGEGPAVEVALLVADRFQGRSVARRLVRDVLGDPRWRGWTIRAVVQPQNAAVLRLLRGQGLGPVSVVDRAPGEWRYAVSIPAVSIPARTVPARTVPVLAP